MKLRFELRQLKRLGDTYYSLASAYWKMGRLDDAYNAYWEAKVEAERLASEAAVKAEELKAAAEVEAQELKEAAAEKASEAMTALTMPAAYDKCKGCHGDDGKTAALGKSAVIGGQSKEAIIASMNAYKAGTKNEVGMGALMKGQAASMSDEDIEAVAEYLSKQ